MPKRSDYIVLAVACSLALCAGAVVANPDPAPVWGDLATANDYGHVTYTFDSGMNTFNFTLFNDQTVAGQKIGGWAVYPTYVLTGIVPTVEKTPPPGWMTTAWEGPVAGGLGPRFGDIRDGFFTTSSVFNLNPNSSLSGFAIKWVGANPPINNLQFAVEVVRPAGSFWAQAGPNPCVPPIPDASTLVLAGSGILMGLPSLKRTFRRRSA